MGIIQWIFLALGLIGMVYGLNIVRQREARLYRRGEMRVYRNRAAYAVGGGITIAGFGLVLFAFYGFAIIAISLACSGAYFLGLYWADRL